MPLGSLRELLARRRRMDASPRPPSMAATTGTTAIVATASAGPLLEVLRAFSAEEARESFVDGLLVSATTMFFENGGREAELVRVSDWMDLSNGLQAAPSFDLAAMPDTATLEGRAAAKVVETAIGICERRRALLLVDPPELEDVVDWVTSLPASPNAAVYHPQVGGVPPSAAVAGVLARLDRERGAWRSPTGPRAALAGGHRVTAEPPEREVDELIAAGINPIRRLPDGSPYLWSARTLSSDPEWKYVSVRRLLMFLERSIEQGTKWVVFEPNGEATWAAVCGSVDSFLTQQWRTGALAGTTAEEAFFVRCDRSTTTQADIAAGRFVCLVGVAPAKPAEFAIRRIELRAGG